MASKTSIVFSSILALGASGFTTVLGLVGAGRATNPFNHEFGKYLAMFSMLGFIVVLVILINVLKNRIELNPPKMYEGKQKFRSF